MRDSLTALAGAVVLVLVAALAVPPFIDWSAHRALIDRTLSDSLGAGARSEGAIDLRLLPSPHLRLARLRLGAEDGPALDAQAVDAEIALAPLLKGEVRFVQTSVERAGLTLPVSDEALLLPREPQTLRRDIVIDDLRIRRLTVATLRTGEAPQEQFAAENLRLRAPALAGPWLAEGTAKGSPFHLATSVAGSDGSLSLKLTGGGDTMPRLELDARITLKPEDASDADRVRRGLVPEAKGTARLTVGPPVQPAGAVLPLTLAAKFASRGPLVQAETVELELDPGGKAARLSGNGRLDLREARLGLTLRTRRLDLDGLLLSGGARGLLAQGLTSGALTPPLLLDLDLSAESVALGLDDWADVGFRGTFDRTGGLVLRRFEGRAPGAATVAATGEAELLGSPRFTGHIDVATRNSEALGRYLGRIGAEESVTAILDGRAFEIGTDLSAAGTDLSLRNLRLALGEARVTGNARYLRADANGRGRLDAQLSATGIDIAELPPLGELMSGLHRHDLGLTLKARDVRYGPAGAHSGNGTIAVSLQSDGASLVVDTLDIADLAGASAQLAGRIAPDGSGRIEGRVTAGKAAPLLALLERGFLPEARFVPQSVRQSGLALDLTLERESGEADALRASAKGKAGEGDLDLALLTRSGRIDRLDATLTTQKTGRWFGRDDIAALRQPGRLRLTGARPSAEAGQQSTPPLALGIEGDLAGLTVSTPRPILFDALDRPPAGGTLRLAAPDLAPFLILAGGAAPAAGPLPASLTLALSRRNAALHADVTGQVAGTDLTAALDRAPDGALTGTATLARLSLPALVAATVLPTDAGGRFAPLPVQPQVNLGLTIRQLDLGRGLVADNASLTLVREGDALSLRDLSAGLAGGRLGGSITLARPAGAAAVSGEGSVEGADLTGLVGAGPVTGRLSAALRFGATGVSLSALANDLSGNGEIRLTDLVLPGADAGAVDRALGKALAEDDPLREGRLQVLVSEELSAGPLRAKGPVSAAFTLSVGTLRTGPFGIDLGPARWNGTLQVDLRNRVLDARGALTAAAGPKGWTGAAPSIQLGFGGPLGAPERRLDAAPLTTGLAALVLQRELEKIELFDADQSERQRRRARIEMDRARLAAEEAARQARLKAQLAAEEAARLARQREAEEATRRARIEAEPAPAPATQPLDISPPSARP
ncbi:MAG: AsmA family protein [Methylorubrum extorquens]|uniref:AsmA family protein n=1 Tax=Methylorubrum extorquens TaxID=408 RepID=UPI002FEE45A5